MGFANRALIGSIMPQVGRPTANERGLADGRQCSGVGDDLPTTMNNCTFFTFVIRNYFDWWKTLGALERRPKFGLL
jgi:hypothetical protein